jgi:hypothetical protein
MENFKEAYEGTKFMVFNPTLVIEVNKKCHELDELLKQHNTSEWAYITAWNPFSEVLTDAENSQSHQKLIELVKEYQYFEGEGVGTDPAWNPEKSLLILGITKEKAIEIGTKFEQNAIVYGRINEPAELLHLFDFL